jgi:plastocyanin
MRKVLWIACLIALAVAVPTLVGCSAATPAPSPSASSGAGASSSGAGGAAVSIANFAFNPADLTVKAGDSVTWTNNDSAPHTVTSDSGAFDSGQLSQGAKFTQKFDKAGTYSYHCTNHPSMTAKITVQ